MRKSFKSLLLLLSAGLFTATGWAVTLIDPNPTASFTDFSSIPTGTTAEAKTLTVNGVTLTLPVGVTKNDDGSVYLNNQTGAKVALATETETVAVVLDLAVAPVAPENPSNTSYTLLVNFDSGTDIAAAYTGTGIQGAWGGSLSGRGAVKAWTPEATKVLAATSSTGGTTIRVKDNTDANKWDESGLKSSTNRYKNIDLGPTLTLKGIYVYQTYETAMPAFTEVSAYERTIEGTKDWAATDAWATGVANPETGTLATLNVTGDAELTMNEASNALNYLEINGSGSLTITGSNPLTATSTLVNVSTTVNTSASLGAVTLGNDATLTVKSLDAFTSIAGVGTLALDLGAEANVEYTGEFPSTVKLSLLSGTLTYKHNGAHRAIKALNIAGEATFEDVADYKYNLTINDKFSGAGTYLVKVPTISSQTDGWRYLFVNGDAAEFTGNVKLQIQHNANQNQNGGAPYRTGMRLTGTSFGGTVTAEATGEGVTDADLAYAHLDIDESLTMTKAQSFAGKIDIASGKTLTASNGITLTNAGKLEGTGTIAAPFTYSSSAETSFSGIFSGDLTVSAGVLEIATKQNSVANTVDVTVNGGVLRLDVDHNSINDNNVVFAEGRTITVNAGGVLELERGYGYFKIAGNGLTKVVDSNFYFGISGNGTNNITTALEVDTDKIFWIRNWGGTGYKLTPASLTLNGDLKRDTAKGGTFTVETSSLKGKGVIEGMALTLADNAVIDVTSGAVNATTTATLPSAFMVKISADQDATGVVTVMTSPNVVITGKTATVWVGEEKVEYTLHADATTVWVEKAGVELLETVEVAFTEGGTLVLSDALNGKALAPNATLWINFGDKGENEPNPGIFEFDCDATFAQITITGTNGGTITKTGTVTVTASSTTIDADTTVNAGAANLGTVTINAEKTLTVKENWANVAKNVPTTATNLGKIRFDGGSAETPIVFSMGSSANANPGALVMAPSAVVKLTATGGNKLYNITGETGGDKANVLLYSGQDWGMTDGSVVRDVKLIVPSADNHDFWLRPGVTDATVDLELQGRKLTGDSGDGAIVLGDFVTNAQVVANGKSLSVQTGRISGTAGFDSAIAVDNSGAGSFTVARAYGSSLTIGSNGSVTVAEGGSLTGAVSVTGALTYATNATATNTITNNGTITADTATVDLTGATILGTGTYAVTNDATLILPVSATIDKTITVADGATLKVALAANEQLADQSVTVTGGSVQFVDANNHETVLSDGNTYTAPLNTWTNSAGDAAWDTTSNWSKGALPSETENVKIQIAEGTTLVLTEDVTVAALRVTGTGTLSITGGKLTASFIDAETAISASDETLALVPMTIAENVAVTYGTTANATMPALTGSGTFTKNGTATLTLGNTTACEPTIDVTGGTLELSGDPGGAWTYAYDGVYRFIAREGATIDIANAFIDMPSTESEITLKGGALLNIKNGNIWENRRSIGAKILIEESSAGKPAIIKGSTNGDYSKLTGGITGSGVLEIQGNGNTFAITGAIKDQENAQLAVKINTANGVTFSGANTYTGGTEIVAGAQLINDNGSALGNGKVTGAGTLIVNIGKHPGNHDKFGFADAANWTGTVEFTGGNFQTPVEFSKWQNANSKFKVASGATVFAANGHTFAGTLMGAGTITNTLTFAEDATLDTTAGTLTANTLADLPAALTVKVANALEVGGTLDIMTTTATPNTDATRVTVKVGDEEAEGTYSLVATGSALQLRREEDSLMGTIVLKETNSSLTTKLTSGQMGDGEQWGVQIDMDAAKPYGPGWQTTQALKTFSVVRAKNDLSQDWTNITVSIVDVDAPETVLATSTVGVEETDYTLTYSGGGTEERKLLTFTFATAVDLDASKTYQFRFNEARKIRMMHIQSISDNAKNTNAINVLNSSFVIEKSTEYTPIVELGVEIPALVINASVTPVDVEEVPTTLVLDAVSFSGYGKTFTVLQYTGDGTPDWKRMTVKGLPAGAEVVIDDVNKTWGFAIKTLNVLTVGDSITAGLVTYHNSNANWHVPGGYRLPLYKYLTRAGYSVKYLGSSDVFGTSSVGGGNANEANPSPSLGDNDHHEGHSGITLVTMLERFNNTNVQNEIASQGTPDVITLHLGTNDIMGVDDNTTDDAISADAEKVLTRMNDLLNRLQELYPNTKILVAKIIARSGNKNKVVTEFNKKLNTFFESNQEENLILVDLGINSVSYGLLRYDGLHPSTEGYKQMAEGWFNAIEAEFDPLGDSMEAPTPATSTPMEDVTESDRTVDTVGMAGVLKAAEWTTFTGFATGYLSQFGYMPDSERPWQLDVRGENVPTVADGVLSLNGAPITVNPVDGRLGTTKSTYTIVMKVSDLVANDVIFTDSSVRNDDWPENVNTNYKGTTNADLLKMTVVNATTLKVQYKENSEQTVSLTGVNLTDATPEVIAVVVKQNAFSIFVNGTKVATDVSLGGAINESYRGSFSIGALSADNAGSAMKLYRLSFYEGEVTAIAAPFAPATTEAIINVGKGAGQYITWETAKTGLNLADEMESLTINFTADAQNFNFDNTDAVTIDSVTVQGTAGGTIANAGTATVTTADLDVTTSVTMEDDAMVLTGDVNVATGCVLTYNVGDGMTVNATHTGSGSIAVTNPGVYNGGELEITKTCSVNVAVNASASLVVNVDPAFNGNNFTKALADNVTVSGEGSVALQQGIAYANFDVAYVDVDGTYYLGIGGTAQNPVGSFTPDMLYVGEGAALKVRAYRAYSLTVNTVYVEGVIEKDGGNVTPTMTVTADGGVTSYSGEGQINLTLILEDGVLLEGETGLTVQNLQLPNTLKIDESALPSVETPVVLFKTTAFAAAPGQVEGVTLMVNDQATENYLLYKTAEALELRYAPWTTVKEVTASGAVNSWSALLEEMEANRQVFEEGVVPSLTINFGDKPLDGDAVPGTFTFDDGDVTVASITVTGTNGGRIVAPNGTTVTVSTSAAINTAVAVTGQVMLNGVTIAENGALSITDWRVIGDNTIAGAGLLTVTGATLPTDVTVRVTDAWTGTVKLTDITDDKLNLANMVTANSNLTLNNVKAYIYDCTINTLTLEGDFQMNNGTTTKSKTQCVTVNALAGSGAFIGHQSADVCIAVNVKSWTNFTGSIDLSNEKSKNTIFFFGKAPERFTTSITPGNVGADDSDFTDADYGTVYVTADNTVATAATSTWKLQKLVVETGAAFQINGWATLATSCTGAVTVENGGVLDLRALTDGQLEEINVTVKAGGRLLVNTGATVPKSIVFEEGAILGICSSHIDEIGSATLTVTADGTAKSVATKKGYKIDGVTELGNWTDKEDADPNDNTLSFGYDPVFDGELCWWAYEFDNEVNTSNESNRGPISTGRDKTRMTFDDRNNSNRHCEGNEYVVTSEEGKPVTKAIRLASGAYRSATWPEAGFTAAAYGRLTSKPNRVLFAFGKTDSSNPTIALATGASANAVQLVLIAGRQDTTTPWTPDVDTPYASPITVLAETTVPNATTEDHLFAFSYELKDTDKDGTKDATEIIFYVDGDKYQPYKVNKVLTIGGGFQMGTTFGGVPDQYLTRMNEEDVNSTIEFLRVYDKVLPEATFTAMANAYPYISKVGRATRTIVAGADTTWHESSGDPLKGEWSQVKVVDGVAQEAVDQDKPDFGTIEHPEVGTQVVLNVDGANTLYLNEFYSTTTNAQTGKTETNGNSKLYYERLEINDVAGDAADSLTMWAGRLNENEDPAYKNSQSAVLTVLGYTKINTNVTFAHNVAYLSGPVAVAEGKTLTFDFSGFDVMKVPMMPTEYRLTGFLDEDTRTRVTHNFQGDNLTVNARWVDLSYKDDVNQYTFKVDRYPVTAYFRNQDDIDSGADGVNASQTAIDFNNLYYMWKGLTSGKRMDWDVDTVDANGNHVDEHILANFVSVDAETQQPKMVTVTLDTIDGTPIDLTLPATALKKRVTHGNDGNGDPIWQEVNMLGTEQLIVAEKVTVNYTGENVSTLAPFVKEVSGMVKATAMGVAETTTEWRGNLTLDNGENAVAIAGTNTISGKLVLGKSITLAADADVTAKDADLTAVKNIRIVYDANKTEYKLLTLGEGHTAKSLEGCTVTAVDGEGATVATWTETEGEEGDKKLVVIRDNALYVTGRPVVKAGETAIATNDGLTLPLARRAAELGATSVSLTGVVNTAGGTVDAPVADAAEVFTNVAFDMTKTPDANGAVEAKLKYDFGVTKIGVVTIGGTQYVVAELIVSNNEDLNQNSAAYADGATIDVTVTLGGAAQPVTVEAAANMTGATVAPAAELPASTRYIRFPMPSGIGTFKIKPRAQK